MDLSYTAEQQLLKDSIQKFLEDNYDLAKRRDLAASDDGFSRENWQQFADLGWLALPFSEEDGGFGGTPVDTMILMEEFGKGLVVEPYLATVIMFGGALAHAGSEQQRSNLIPGIADGSLMGCFAYAEKQAHHDLNDVVTSATKEADGYRINGTKSVVLNAASADKILVSTRTSGDSRDPGGITLFIVDASAEGVSREDYPTVDGLRASEVTFDNVLVSEADMLGAIDQGSAIVAHIASRAILALSAEAVGAMDILYNTTIEYTRGRDQFGHPLADFQVLKHRMTEMFMEYTLSQSLTMKACMLASQDSSETESTVHALKFLIGKAGRFVGQNAVQLHGGMGMTEEMNVAHYFKRLMVIDSQFGNTDYHLEQFVA